MRELANQLTLARLHTRKETVPAAQNHLSRGATGGRRRPLHTLRCKGSPQPAVLMPSEAAAMANEFSSADEKLSTFSFVVRAVELLFQ